MANSYPASGQVILDDLKVCTNARLQPHFVSYGEHMFMNLESAHNNSYLPVVTFSRAGCTLGAIGLDRASNSDALGSYAESEMVIGTRANTPTSIQTNGVRRINIASGGNISIGASSPFPTPKVDIRSSCPLTSAVGQSLFLGSNDVTGPLGVVIQHIFAHGVCRVDFTSTRYGISGNDLSLNVDSSDPDTAGGLYIKYRGNVGIGTSAPSTKFNIRHRVDRAYTPNSFNDTLHAMHIEFCNQNQRAGLIRFTSHGNLENTFGVVQVGCAASGCGQGDFVFQAYREAGGAAYNELMRLTNTGCVGIGTSSPSYRLHVNGTFYSAGSSVDYKQSICQYNTDSCMFMKLTPVTYQYKDEYTHLGKELKSETQIGLIAEDVAEVYPELAILVNEDDNKVVRNVDYEKLSIILLSEVQKLRKEVDNLKNNK